MYTTKAEMIDRYGEAELLRLTDRDGAAEAIVDTVLDRAIADAQGVVDGYLAKRYALPLATTPEILKPTASAIALYFLWPHAPEEVRNRYRDAIRQLEAIAAGTVQLDVAGAAPAAAGGGAVFVEAPERLVSRETLKSY